MFVPVQFKYRLLKRYGGECAVCGLRLKPLLEAAHIKPYAKGGSNHSGNGVLLCRNHHRAFDQGLFSFSNEGKILSTTAYSTNELQISVAQLSVLPHPTALNYHRRIHGFSSSV